MATKKKKKAKKPKKKVLDSDELVAKWEEEGGGYDLSSKASDERRGSYDAAMAMDDSGYDPDEPLRSTPVPLPRIPIPPIPTIATEGMLFLSSLC